MRILRHFKRVMVRSIWIVSGRVMNEILQVVKMVLSLEQCAFTVKRYYETHLLKYVCDDFIQEFSNFVPPPDNAILILIFKNSKTNIHSMIYPDWDNSL